MLGHLGDRIPFDEVRQVTNAQEVVQMQQQIESVQVSGPVSEYIVSLVQSTRSHPLVLMGAGPRGSRSLYKASKACAAIRGRSFVTPDDVQSLAIPVLAHRLLLGNEARLSGETGESVLRAILQAVPVPPVGEARFG